MNEIGRTLIIFGLILIVIGALFQVSGKIPGFGRLPGDIVVKKENFSFYFSITTSLLLSLLLSIILFFLNRR